MILALAVAAAAALPPAVQPCVDAVRAGSPEAARVCVLPPESGFLDRGIAPSCEAVIKDGPGTAHMLASMADAPKMAAGMRANFDRGLAACAADTASPPRPAANDRKTMPRLWD